MDIIAIKILRNELGGGDLILRIKENLSFFYFIAVVADSPYAITIINDDKIIHQFPMIG
ncbi:MAG: hypothetical protein DDT42_01885 [candidate division WS2 bacterium]|uniref:Uncharacterized protein n=1 Tax=Psychracetigena formicireducens TaxID=2986056 RepID=A0A9E2F5A8_PSYF1|nr:hypothetical protein [Candidatus Psychracetigena formicireducens]